MLGYGQERKLVNMIESCKREERRMQKEKSCGHKERRQFQDTRRGGSFSGHEG